MFVKWLRRQILPRWIPVRAIIAIMMFTACWTSYMCRMQMPILAVPMIAEVSKNDDVVINAYKEIQKPTEPPSPPPKSEPSGKEEKAGGGQQKPGDSQAIWQDSDMLIHDIVMEERGPRVKRSTTVPKRGIFELFSGTPFDWSPSIRGQIIGGYGYGNVPGNLIGGVLAMKLGPRHTILWTSLVAALVSLITPLLANLHWSGLLVARIIVGLSGGVIFPACHTLVAKWSPPDEKARFVWSLLGGTFGTVFTYPMITMIADSINWESAWYIPSAMMLIWVFFWWLFVYDSPAEHPGITDEEKNYIITSQEGTIRAAKPSLKETPILAILTSIPFLSLVICHFGNLFLLFFYQNSMMMYLTKVLKFKLTKGGIYASLPWMARIIFGFFFSWSGDIVKRKQIFSLTVFRKAATIFSHLIPGIFLVLVGYSGDSFVLANVFLFLALGFNGAATLSNLSNNQDLSPNFAGFLYGIMNTIGTTTAIIIPPMVEAIAGKHDNALDRWQIVFWIGGGVCIISMIIFIIGGSAQIQSWNEGKKPATTA